MIAESGICYRNQVIVHYRIIGCCLVMRDSWVGMSDCRVIVVDYCGFLLDSYI